MPGDTTSACCPVPGTAAEGPRCTGLRLCQPGRRPARHQEASQSGCTAGSDCPPAFRCRLLESIRDYGLERLAEEGVLAEAQDRHLAQWLARAEAAYEERRASGFELLLAVLMDELDNLRAALEYALTTDPTRGLRLAAAVRHQLAPQHNRGPRMA